jgi:hypothetical protein
MRCPHCGSVVEPMRDALGALVCPACNNTWLVGAFPPPPGMAAPFAHLSAAGPQVQPPPREAPKIAVWAMVFGIAALVLFPISILLGPVAIVLGIKALGAIKRMPPGTQGQGMAVTGLVLGGIAILVGITVVLAAVVFVLVSNLAEPEPAVFTFDVDASGAGGTLTLTNATGDLGTWSDYELQGDARCTLPGGDIDVGDRIVCVTDGDVHLVDWIDEETVYSTFV